MARFKSVMVENGSCLQTMAAYIDLNYPAGFRLALRNWLRITMALSRWQSVRAGLVRKPEDYRWCGYAEALGGEQADAAGALPGDRVAG